MAGVRVDGANGNLKGKTSMLGFATAAVVMADANYTPTESEYECPVLDVTSSVALTATRNVVLPLGNGKTVIVYNGTTGGQSLQFIGATGTGITVANGKHAILRSNGTNWLRVTPDT